MLQPESEYFYLMSHWQIFDGLFIDSKWLMGKKDAFHAHGQGAQDESRDLLLFFVMI